MVASFQEILNSRIFKFIVGEAVDGKPHEFSVHEDAIAQLSTPLRALTKSSPESRAGSATWRDVSKVTFERFVQYAYTGDYSVPETEKRSEVASPKVNGIHAQTSDQLSQSSDVAQNGLRGRVNSLESEETLTNSTHNGLPSEKLEDEGTILNYPLPNKKHKKKKAKAAIEKAQKDAREAEEKAKNEPIKEPGGQPEDEAVVLEEPEQVTEDLQTTPEPKPAAGQEDLTEHILTPDFKSLFFPTLASRDNYEGTCEPCTEFDKDHSYSDVLLCHASLYILGDAEQVENLKALALFKLHKTLCIFELDNENVGDITDLARYAYSREDQKSNDGIGGLRSLVCQYLALHAKELSGDVRFMNLLAGGGQIVKDFFQFQLQRIN